MNGAIPSAALAAARALDDAGRHDQAIDALARATREGDVQSMTELGHRLLVGDRAPQLADHGASMIADAAQRGEGRALARLAALTAAGVHARQDWAQALRLLGAAADAGDLDAQGQLASLQAESAGTWRDGAAAVDVPFWTSAADSTALHPKVHHIEALAPPSVCAWLIGRAHGKLTRARVYDAVMRQEIVHGMRSNTAANFNYATMDVVQLLLQSRMARTCGIDVRQFEAPMVLHYHVGEEIRPHYDFIDTKAPDYEQQIREQGQRIITFLLYLNDEYEGGETTFPRLDIVNRGRKGNGLYFINSNADRSPDREMLHTGSPPTSGEKWIVSQFIRDITLRT
ncbi:MAG: 2OG-Fe(II) oxygenase [Steroidobacteraceae bacterium]